MKDSLKSPLLLKYESALKANPESRVFAPLAEAYRSLGMLDMAFDILRTGIRKHPNYTMGYLSLAHCYFDQSKFDLCYSTLRPLVATNLDNIKLQRLFAEVCYKQERYAEALDTYKYLLFLNPKDDQVAKKIKELEDQDGQSGHNSIDENPVLAEVNDNDIESWETKSFQNQVAPSIEETVTDDIEEVDIQTDLSDPEDEIEAWSMESSIVLDEPEKENKAKAPEKEDGHGSPMVTHTIAELYIAQGHYKKALEVLLKFTELGNDDEHTLQKIEEVKTLMKSKRKTPVKEESVDLFDSLSEEEESSGGLQLSDDDEEEGDSPLMLFDEDEESEEDAPALLVVDDEEEETTTELPDNNDLMQAYDNQYLAREVNKRESVEKYMNNFLALVHKRSKQVKERYESSNN